LPELGSGRSSIWATAALSSSALLGLSTFGKGLQFENIGMRID